MDAALNLLTVTVAESGPLPTRGCVMLSCMHSCAAADEADEADGI